MVVAKKHHELYEELSTIVGAKYVSDQRAVLLSYTRDMSTVPAGKPQGIVVRPGCTEEVAEVVKLANRTRTPIVPIGGKASIAGMPPGEPGRAIVVDMKRMDKVIEIDKVNMAVTAQAGITWGELAGRVNAEGYDVHTAGTPHFIDTIGGHISGVPGAGFGGYGFSVGWNYHYLLGVKVVMPDGSVIDTGTGEGSLNSYRGNTWSRSMHGPDLTGMFTGDAGIFGIKVEATYRMFHLPKFQKGGARCWDNLDDAYKAYWELWETDPALYMQPYATGMILSPEFIKLADPTGDPKWVLFFICIGNSQEEVDLKFKTTDGVCANYGGKVAGQAILELTTHFNDFTHDLSKMATLGELPLLETIVSRRDHLEIYKWSREYLFNALEKNGIDKNKLMFISGLLSSGPGYGLTTIVPYLDQSNPELVEKIHGIWVEFLEQVTRKGVALDAIMGMYSKIMAKRWTPEYYHFIRNMKRILDPNNIMNPGLFNM